MSSSNQNYGADDDLSGAEGQPAQTEAPNEPRSFYASNVATLLATPDEDIVGRLATRVSLLHSGDEARQVRAWRDEVRILKVAFEAFGADAHAWGVLLELPLLRLGRRIDAVILIGDWVACIEFKIGASRFGGADIDQVVDYALCLRDFHAASRDRQIVPILCADKSPGEKNRLEIETLENVSDCLLTNAGALRDALDAIRRAANSSQLDWRTFDSATYNPTPDIVTAARGLYAGHSVTEIGRTDASGDALERTAEKLRKIVEAARRDRRKVICFVTGEPGAGKTLLGLELVLKGAEGRVAGEPAALLSGNRPLVYVLQEAIAEDARARTGVKAKEARRQAQQALQTLLGYLKDHAGPTSAPPEHVIVFDEAQRAWDAETGLKLLDRESSEPELFLEILGRLDWACLVCLVGPGQEINRGEAGLPLWGEALAKSNEWTAYVSETALEGRRGLPGLLDGVNADNVNLQLEPDLHLATNLRAYRNDLHGRWVEALLAGEIDAAASVARDMAHPPAYLTRDLDELRRWLKTRQRGDRRVGLLASSGAVRLIADGIPPSPMSNELNDVVHWFLRPAGDFRSSNALERPLSEFVCQGLEIDYAGVCWGNDLIWDGHTWKPRKMRAPKWQLVKKEEARRHRVNTYRVLLTRARAGVVIYVPFGDDEDQSRTSSDFSGVSHVLRDAGCVTLTHEELNHLHSAQMR